MRFKWAIVVQSHAMSCVLTYQRGRLAVGYTAAGQPALLTNLGWAAPAGQMFSSVSDVAQIAALVFREDNNYDSNGQDIPVLQPQVRARLLSTPT
jgi:hypothetical protein